MRTVQNNCLILQILGENWLDWLRRQLLNGSQDFFFRFSILIYFFKYKTIETHAPAFLPLNISAVGTVLDVFCQKIIIWYQKFEVFFPTQILNFWTIDPKNDHTKNLLIHWVIRQDTWCFSWSKFNYANFCWNLSKDWVILEDLENCSQLIISLTLFY